MAVVWQNTLDGSDGVAVTTTNSADHGDALAAVNGTVVYDTSWSAAGSASILLGGPGVGSFNGVEPPDWPTGTTAWRMYLRVASDDALDIAMSPDTGSIMAATVRGNGDLDHPGGTETGVLPTDGSAFRLEILVDGTAWTVQAYVTDPDGTTPDVDATGTLASAPSGDWSAFIEDYSAGGVHADEMVITDTAAPVGPVAPPPATITTDNTLTGADGAAVTDATLAASAQTGTVTVSDANNTGTGLSPQAAYSDTQQVFSGQTMVRLWQCNHRDGTTRDDGLSAGPQPKLAFSIPGAPWAIRFYAYFPAGWNTWNEQYDDLFNERCWLVRLGDYALTVYETGSGNIGFRMQPLDLDAAGVNVSLGGSAHALNDELIRVEVLCDGTDTTIYTYLGQDESTPRTATLAGFAPSADANNLTGYPFTFGSYLPYGNGSFDQRVADYQQKLIDQGYPAPEWGADGFYGDEMAGQWDAYAADVGLDSLVGTFGAGGGAGAEILRAIDVDRSTARVSGSSLPTSVYVGYLAVADTAALIGPAEEPSDGVVVSPAGGIVLGGTAQASRNARPASSGGIVLGGSASPRKHVTVSASGGITLGGAAAASKSTTIGASGGIVLGGGVDTEQGTTLFIDYGAGHVSDPFEPIDDDQHIRNDVEVKREGGSSARHVQETGPLSVLPPPDGVGVYDESVTLNVADDDQLADQAAWRVHLGTVDEARYPQVRVDLSNKSFLVDDVTSRDSGDWLRVINPPEWLPPRDIDLLIQGYTETISVFTWNIVFNASDAAAYTVGEVYAPATIGGPDRADTSGSRLWTDITAGQASFDVEVYDGPPWIASAALPGEFPFDIRVGGEVMTVTAAAAPLGDLQEFTVVRSVNGISKPHTEGTAVELAAPAVVAL
ncbi:hypothetical protein [Streptomonospora wellingtoniae]|uniref:Uncharacterized protein n=1 Tax=Streptomonospora wellingtoniae TaxID=3075544 RepID=A0ABU2L0G9_9ACTN|nr:hypothetical protein [Streptomonospora sp. DSM 45055]MDT0305056.1 hypothetical protein [Streptomonospora sp. DSM 45055]